MHHQKKNQPAASTGKAAHNSCNGFDNGASDLQLLTGSIDNKAMNRFNILVAKEVIPIFTGDYKDLEAFLTAVELLNESMTPEEQKTLLHYVYFVKLSAEVRLAVSLPNKPINFEELKRNLRRRYKEFKPRNYVEKLEEEFVTATQGDLSVQEFREKLLQIHEKLAHKRLQHVKGEKLKQSKLEELASDVLDRFKFCVNLPFNTKLSNCKTLDDAVETALYLESTGEVDDMNTSDEDRALIRAGFFPLDYGLPKTGKQSMQKTQNGCVPSVFSVPQCTDSASSGNASPVETIRLFCDQYSIAMRCKNAKGREPLRFFIRNTAPYSVIKSNKVCARDINYCRQTYEAPACFGMEMIKSIGNIQLTLNLKPGVNLKFWFLVVDESDFPILTDGMISGDFISEYMESMYIGKEIVIKHRGSLYHFPIELSATSDMM